MHEDEVVLGRAGVEVDDAGARRAGAVVVVADDAGQGAAGAGVDADARVVVGRVAEGQGHLAAAGRVAVPDARRAHGHVAEGRRVGGGAVGEAVDAAARGEGLGVVADVVAGQVGAVAVLVDVVGADLRGAREDAVVEVAAVGRVGVAVVVVVGVDAVGLEVAVEVVEAVDERAVAVAVDVVAQLNRVGRDAGVHRGAVVAVQRAVAVDVVVDAVGLEVAVQVVEFVDQGAVAVAVDRVAQLDRGGVDRRVGVVAVAGQGREAVAVDVVVGAVGHAVVVGVRLALEQVAVAVGVDEVAAIIQRAGEDRRVGVVAVGDAGVAVVVVVLVDAVRLGVAVEVVEAVVGYPVAVLVEAVADLGRAGEDRRVEVVAVDQLIAAVVVVVEVDAVGLEVAVEVVEGVDQGAVAVGVDVVAELGGAGVDGGVEVVAVGAGVLAVAVDVAVDAVGRAVVVRVVELVDEASIAVAVDGVAGLGRAVEDGGVEVVAVARGRVAVAVHVEVDAVGLEVAVEVVEAVDEAAVAVAVDVVAELRGRRVGGGVEVVAVERGVDAVVVRVLVDAVRGAVAVEVVELVDDEQVAVLVDVVAELFGAGVDVLVVVVAVAVGGREAVAVLVERVVAIAALTQLPGAREVHEAEGVLVLLQEVVGLVQGEGGVAAPADHRRRGHAVAVGQAGGLEGGLRAAADAQVPGHRFAFADVVLAGEAGVELGEGVAEAVQHAEGRVVAGSVEHAVGVDGGHEEGVDLVRGAAAGGHDGVVGADLAVPVPGDLDHDRAGHERGEHGAVGEGLLALTGGGHPAAGGLGHAVVDEGVEHRPGRGGGGGERGGVAQPVHDLVDLEAVVQLTGEVVGDEELDVGGQVVDLDQRRRGVVVVVVRGVVVVDRVVVVRGVVVVDRVVVVGRGVVVVARDVVVVDRGVVVVAHVIRTPRQPGQEEQNRQPQRGVPRAHTLDHVQTLVGQGLPPAALGTIDGAVPAVRGSFETRPGRRLRRTEAAAPGPGGYASKPAWRPKSCAVPSRFPPS